MKKTISLILALMLTLALTACGAKEPQTQEAPAPATTETVTPAETPAPTETPATTVENAAAEAEQTAEGDVLVAYFSATGTTKGVAEKLASAVGGDLYEIVPAEPYSDADLNWNDRESRSTREQNDKSARPGIASETLDLSGYATIYVGYPIWWGEEPRIMDTFVESYDFSGKTMIPFCTSSSSGIGSSGRNMEQLTSGATWLDGSRFSGGVSEDELRAWADGLQ
ncbi:MAG: flavodoxin [Oscillospiraceae bacterium]|nr:flavodoxin [Oscillospiraceae bacterium]